MALKRIGILLAAFAVIAIIYIFLVLSYLTGFGSSWWNRTSFDRNEWLNWSYESVSLSTRWDMIVDIQRTHDFVGISKGGVIQILGKPDVSNASDFGYDLGYSRSGINTGYLKFETDANNVVINLTVWDG